MYSVEQLLELRKSGKYPVATLKIFENIQRINPSPKTVENIKCTEDEYINRINDFMKLDEEKREIILTIIKNNENLDNQTLEREPSFGLQVYQALTNETPIDYLLNNQPMDKDIFIQGHKIILKGTKEENLSNTDFRHNNDTYIPITNRDGVVKPYYFALDYNDIPNAIDNIIAYYNSNNGENVFERPIITHGLVGALQMFNDGNTRYARLLQYIKIYNLTNELYSDFKSDKPYIYGTRSYFPYRDNYRQLMADLVTKGNNDAWNNWINFNLNRIQDTMYYEDPVIQKYK